MSAFSIQQPDTNTKEAASETRLRLAELIGRFDSAVQATPISKDRIAELKAMLPLAEFAHALADRTLYQIWHQSVDVEYRRGLNPEEGSYLLEGAIARLRKQLFQAEMLHVLQEPATLKILLLGAVAPRTTTGAEDQEVHEHFGTVGTVYSQVFQNVDLVRAARNAPNRAKMLAQAGLEHTGHTSVPQYCRCGCGERIYDTSRTEPRWGIGLFREYFDDEGEPYVAGLLSPKDVASLRFRRTRLGSFLAELGLSASEVKAMVNSVKSEQASAEFVVYPNDIPWGDVYLQGREYVGSCMAYDVEHFDSCKWTKWHPVDAYSSAYFGTGDNALALVTQVNAEGSIVGRGILNTQANKVVRWYGDVTGSRALKRAGLRQDSGALEGSWLSLIADVDDKDDAMYFLHPYVDGDVDHGCVDWETRRIHLDCESQPLCDTDGYSAFDVPRRYCEYNQRWYRDTAVTYQPVTGTWIRTASIENARLDWACAITGEFVQPGSRRYYSVDGVDQGTVNGYDIYRAIERGDLPGWRWVAGMVFERTAKNEEAA